MHSSLVDRSKAIADLCRRFGVVRLEVFGSAARGEDFDPAHSDVDFMVELDDQDTLATFLDFKEVLEDVVGLVEDPCRGDRARVAGGGGRI